MNSLFSRNCKRCNCPLGFVKTPKGENIPIDLRSPVYMVIQNVGQEPQAIRKTDAYVSHFSTCKHASEFSKKGDQHEQPTDAEVDAQTNTQGGNVSAD